MIYIYSSKKQPFGLLSNNASIPIHIDGEEWDTITGYVYVNMFKDKTYQQKMIEHLQPSPYNAFVRLKTEEDSTIYKAAIEKAQLIRFKHNKNLRDRLFSTGSATIIYPDDPIMEEFLTQYRSKLSYSNIIWDDIRHVAVPKDEAVKVIIGVEKKLEKDVDLDDDLTYGQLLHYISSTINVDNRYYNHPALATLNKMVPSIKRSVYKKIYDQQVEQFKNHLLDTQLDTILMTEYPSVYSDTYERAKHQQMVKESPEDIKTYKNQLFDLYERNALDKITKDNLKFIPNKDLLKEIRIAITSQRQGENIYRLFDDDPFLPHFPEDVTVDGKTFKTCVHYAYHVLYDSIGQTHIDVNKTDSVSLLVNQFKSIEEEWIVHNITINNERAQTIKFSNPTLQQLLLLTDHDQLIWDDRTDPILGSAGENRAGIMMEHLRAQSVPSRNMIKSFASNVFFRNWIIMRGNDYKETLKMMDNPNIHDMATIYMCPFLSSTTIPDGERMLLKIHCKLTLKEIEIVWPLLLYQLSILHRLREEDAIKAVVYAQFVLNNKDSLRKDAEKMLGDIYNSISKLNISKQSFIDDILRHSSNRINYWG